MFNCLPFGIGVASHIFSKTLRHIVKYLRSSGYKVVMFLDDGIGGSTDYERALQASTFVKGSLIDFGFLLANDKCNWMPVQRTVWLWHILDTVENKLYITEERIKRLEVSIDSAIFQIGVDKVNLLNVKVLAAIVTGYFYARCAWKNCEVENQRIIQMYFIKGKWESSSVGE